MRFHLKKWSLDPRYRFPELERQINFDHITLTDEYCKTLGAIIQWAMFCTPEGKRIERYINCSTINHFEMTEARP